MSRNGAGVYNVPNSFSSGATITASGHNGNWSDLATEMTNSVAADGQTTITGALKGYVGSAAAPGYSFSSDLDTGIYHSGSNEVSVAVGGAQTAKVSAAGVDAVAGKILEGGNSLVPAGVIWPYGGSSAPSGYLLCDGSSVSRATYANLFSAIGTTFGSADGSHFNLPDTRGRVVAGADAMGGSAANVLQKTTTVSTTNTSTSSTVASATGLYIGMVVASANIPAGTKITAISGTTITLSSPATATASGTAATFSILSDGTAGIGAIGGESGHTLTKTEAPTGLFTLVDGNHSHSYGTFNQVGPQGGAPPGVASGTTTATTGSSSSNLTFTDHAGDGAHNNVPPTLVLNYIIKF